MLLLWKTPIMTLFTSEPFSQLANLPLTILVSSENILDNSRRSKVGDPLQSPARLEVSPNRFLLPQMLSSVRGVLGREAELFILLFKN